jgi:hypothetical protein
LIWCNELPPDTIGSDDFGFLSRAQGGTPGSNSREEDLLLINIGLLELENIKLLKVLEERDNVSF